MIEIVKLIEYSEMAGFPLEANGNELVVKNGSNLPYHLRHQLIIHKNDVIFLLEEM